MVQPLAYRMRPTHIDEVAGQKHIMGKNTALYNMIMKNEVPSMLLYGEPGIGKTSIANAIAGTVDRPFFMINATTAGKKDIENVVKEANKLIEQREKALKEVTEDTTEEEKEKIKAMPQSVILFIDEVHRFNKLQQDALLPHVESGLITLISSTTENPYHSVLPAIRSRCGLIKELKRLTEEDVKEVLLRALNDKEKGLGAMNIKLDDDALTHLSKATNGEVRSALAALEMAVLGTPENENGEIIVTIDIAREATENKGFNHDKDGDGHYNVLSAMQKSIRGSDVDAALHYAARLVQAGDLTSLLRRLVVISFEDIGLGDSQVATDMVAAANACERVGFPEATGILSTMIVRMCLSPKSITGWSAINGALADIQSGDAGEIPMHLRDTHYASAGKLGNGKNYQFPHDYQRGKFGGWANQEYLPEKLKGRQYYFPIIAGKEAEYKKVYEFLKEAKKKK